MMKKIISVILSIMLFVSIAVPALAEESQDEALKRVMQIVKPTLGIDNSYTEFNGDLSNEGDFSYWSLYWSKDGESISVNADANGKVFSYSKNTEDNNYSYNSFYSPSFPKVKSEDVLPVAKAFVEKLLSKNETISFNESNNDIGTQNVSTYQLNGTINYNGLKSPETFSVQIKLNDKSVISFRRTYNSSVYTGTIPSATPAITVDKASELLKGQVKLQLQYVLDKDGKTAVLQYLPVYAEDIAVDANSGSIIELYQNIYYADGASRDSAKATAGNESGLSEVEQSTIGTLVGVYSKSELETALRAISSLGIDSTYTLGSARYTMDKSTGKVQCTLDFIKKISDAGTLQARFPDAYSNMKASGGIYPISISKTITVDAKTRGLISMYTYKSADKEASVQTKEQLKANAETFLTTYMTEKYKASAYNGFDSNSDEGSFTYSQAANGILFPSNSLSVTLNKYDGTIDSFTSSWTDEVTFASADGIISADKAMAAYNACFKTVLQYVAVASESSKADSVSYPKGSSYSKLVLAYKYESDNNIIGIDAKTGKALTETAYNTQTIAYTDLNGCYGKAQIEKLAQYGIGFTGTSFQPTAKLTQKDAITLLISATGYTTDNEDSLYQAAYNYKFLTKAEKDAGKTLTRADFVKMLVGATEYGSAAKLDGIYKSGFRDDSKITKAYYGYVAIAKALKIISGDSKNNFNPSSIMTRQDAAIMLYNFMSR